ncbi:MAG: hypothetical protein WD872_20180 [Pirellulaceae bacterium]
MSGDLPADLRSFVSEHIHSIAQLELLLLLAGEPAKTVSAEDAARVFYLPPDAARGFFESMRATGLLSLEPDGGYRFAPRHAEWVPLVNSLAGFYRERRLSITHLIYSGPTDKVQSFADAFRLKKDK